MSGEREQFVRPLPDACREAMVAMREAGSDFGYFRAELNGEPVAVWLARGTEAADRLWQLANETGGEQQPNIGLASLRPKPEGEPVDWDEHRHILG